MSKISKVMRAAVSPETEQRIFEMRKEVWVGYEQALNVRHSLDQLIKHPDSNRMPCMALIGDSLNGKSMILSNFVKRYPGVTDPNAEKALMPVVMVTMPPSPSESRLYYRILSKFGVAASVREPDESMLRRIAILFSHLETKMLIIDEIFNINGGSHTQHRRILNALRGLCTDLRIPVVIAGVPKIEPILAIDESISNRFRPVYLPTWGVSRLEEYARFVKTIEPHLKLENAWELMNEKALTNLLHFSSGLLGETVSILTKLTELAIRSGEEVLEARHISQEYLDAAGWVSASTGNVQLY